MKKVLHYLFIVCVICLTSYEYKCQNRAEYHRAKIYYNSFEELKNLADLGLEIDHGKHKKNVFIESDFSANELSIAEENGYTVEVVIQHIDEYYVNRNLNNKNYDKNSNADCATLNQFEYTTPENFGLGSMGGFFTYEEILAHLDAMVEQYPELITMKSPISDFQTHEERPIYWLRMSDNANTDEPEPEMLYTAIHHAREPASVSTLIHYMWYLLENYETESEVQAILNNTELYFVPVINPDGYVFNVTTEPDGGGMWRKNRFPNDDGTFGVDNNRNYSVEWGTEGISFNGNSQVYCGTAPFSEPENQAIKWLCENRDFKLALNNHSHSNLLLFPYGYTSNAPTPENNVYELMAAEMVSQNSYADIISSELYPASGVSDDWMYLETDEKPRIFSFTPEIGSTDQGFWPPANEIISLCHETMYLNMTAAHIVTKYGVVHDQSEINFTELSGDINFDLQRLGFQDGTFSVQIVPVTSNISFPNNTVNFPDIGYMDSASGIMNYELAGDIELGDEIVYKYLIDNGDYVQESLIIEKVYGVFEGLFSENGDDISQWDTNDWNVTDEEYYTPSNCITDSPNSNYSDNQSSSIEIIENLDLTNATDAHLTYAAKWQIEEGYDYVVLEVSTDGGMEYAPQCGLYTSTGVQDQFEGAPLYDGEQNEWVEEFIDLSDYLGETIKVRFRLVSDQIVNEDGFYFDDFQINVIESTTGFEDFYSDNTKVSLYPNPATDLTKLDYVLPVGTNNALVNVTDAQGRVIFDRELNQSKGSMEINVNELSSGAYNCVLIIDEIIAAQKKLIIK